MSEETKMAELKFVEVGELKPSQTLLDRNTFVDSKVSFSHASYTPKAVEDKDLEAAIKEIRSVIGAPREVFSSLCKAAQSLAYQAAKDKAFDPAKYITSDVLSDTCKLGRDVVPAWKEMELKDIRVRVIEALKAKKPAAIKLLNMVLERGSSDFSSL